MSVPSILSRKNTHLPREFYISHEFCFFLHDILCQMLVSGERNNAFKHNIKPRDEADRLAFPDKANILDWLEETGRVPDRDSIVINTIFPAALSDMLHCLYEALEASRKGKIAVAFILLRKPIQESLHLFETILATRGDFVSQLKSDPTKLYSQKSGGIESHTRRILRTLPLLPRFGKYDASYLSQLRYDKDSEDSFDGACNKAIHLFTTHHLIRTEPFNLNFIFSDEEAKFSQWSFLYSRLPYILSYAHDLIEALCSTIAPTEPVYLKYIYRRKSALTLLWSKNLQYCYAETRFETLTLNAKQWIENTFEEIGRPPPNEDEIIEIALRDE